MSPEWTLFREAIRAELYRMRRLRSMLWIAAVTLVIVVGAALISFGTLPSGASTERALHAANAAVDIAPAIVGFGATIFVVGDFGNGYIGATLALTPSRRAVVGSKLAAVGIGTALVSASSVAVVSLTFVIHQVSVAGTLGAMQAWGSASFTSVILSIAYAALGAGVGLVTCRSVAAVMLYLTLLFALPLAASVLSIWAPTVGQAFLDFSPVTLTARLVEDGPMWSAAWRFALLDGVLMGAGVLRSLGVRVR